MDIDTLHAQIRDQGYSHHPRGWYDADGSGIFVYGRWVGDSPNIWWSVAGMKDGKYEEYSPRPGTSGSYE